ncbi:MAG: LysR family transcriptional regulator substrate-binding protein [Cytophagales bacterium]|nr:LysR family transcriptional regulator substrate-binding protein [Armatimonadota bacterium]
MGRHPSGCGGGIASGKLRLGIAPPFFPILAAGIVSAFQQQYPETEIALFEGTEAEIASRLKEESLDAALAAPQSGGELDSYLLFQDELCVLVRAGHPLLQKATVTATDLSAEPLIVPMLGRSLAIAMLRGANDGNGRPQIRHLVSDTPTIFALVRAGVGAALLPRSAVPLDASDLSTAALEPPFPITLALLARSWAAASPAALRLRRTAEAWVQQHRSL